MKRLISLVSVFLVIASVVCCSCICAFAEEKQNKLKIGDLLTKMPTTTYKEAVEITEDANIENGEFTISWKPYENAESYSVKAFFNINYMGKKAALNYLYEAEFLSDTNSVNITGLQSHRRYTIMVYALNEAGEEIAVYDSLHAFTYPEPEIPEDELTSGESVFSTSDLLVIIASVVGGLIVVAVIVLIIVLKKTSNK